MSRLTGWLRSGGSTPAEPADENAQAERLEVEKRDLAQAMAWAELIMNDDVDGACEKLEQGDSSFHDLGSAVTIFMRSVLGFEKSVMTETAERLNKCETRAWNDYQRAQKLGVKGTSSKMYPPGTEYELVRAETQLMGAVVGVLHESLVEAMKSFYKLRKAFITLDGIIAAETKAAASARPGTSSTVKPPQKESQASTKNASLESGTPDLSDSSESVFVDAPETASAARTPGDPIVLPDTPEPLDKKLEDMDHKLEELQLTKEQSVKLQFQQTAVDPETVDNPIDKFIHSGANMCFGILLLIITLVPPAFSKILSVVGFRGDRERGIKMLWQASFFGNINGAMAALMLLAYYNAFLGQVDIIPDDKDFDEDAETVGPPRKKCDLLLKEMRKRYPESSLWRVEQARSHARDREVPKALEVLQTGSEPKMKQVLAIANFELSLNALLVQDWVLMRKGFLRCLEVNDWSPTIYYFMAGVASLELYRDAVQAKDEVEARNQKNKAQEYMRKAPTLSGKNRFMARQLPLETFINRKMAKWEARAKELNIDIADAVGPSPALEMAYMWNGQNRMGDAERERAEGNLSWERCTAPAECLAKIKAASDDMAVWALLMASLLKGKKRYADCRALLKDHITSRDR